MASPHLADQVGRVLDGRYRVVAPIGTGASAAVFLADDVVLRRRVAIKVLHAALAGDQAFLKRFQAEAHTAAALSHPNIMRVLDWGEADGGPMLVLEYLGGGSLRTVLDESGSLTVEQAVSVGLQAAKALDYAHRRGLVHRDVKPANLLFDEEGRLAIADFGLARALAEAAWTEPGGAVLGTARYASPEQVRGQTLNGKADVYALGLVLIEAVCGYVPFTLDTTIATLMARLDVQLEAPDEMGALGKIVERATDPNPDTRLDAGELVGMLDEASMSLETPAPIPLPGAVRSADVRVDGVDPTLLPRGSGPPADNGAAAMDPALRPEKRRGLRLGRAKPAPGPADPLPSARRRRGWRKPALKSVLIGLAAIVLALGIASGAYALYFYTGKESVVPQLEGLTIDEARNVARESGIRLSYDGEEFSETVPSGVTFAETQRSGEKVHERERVHLKVSKGPAPRDVVTVTGQQLDDARRALADRSFVVITQNRFDEVAPAGKVLEQRPSSGQQPRGAEVTLVVSGGPQPRPVPSVVGQSYDSAAAAITAQNLKVVRGPDTFSDTVPAGQVASTSPGPGVAVQRGGTVTVSVSKGPDLVAIPNVRGKSVGAATAQLEGAGFQVVDVRGPVSKNVFDTDPTIGTKAKRGSAVSLYTR